MNYDRGNCKIYVIYLYRDIDVSVPSGETLYENSI